MASSPTEAQGQALLRQMGEAYDQALTALNAGALPEMREILDGVDQLIAHLDPQSPQEVDAELLASVRARHGRLLAQLSGQRDEAKKSIQHSQQGKKALKGYGNRATRSGHHHQSQA